MITLRKLTWSNCFSYGEDNSLDLDDSVVTQIIGTNGVGKSSIPLIIEEALFNKNSKGIKKADIPNRFSPVDGYTINLAFTKDDVSYDVHVARNKTKLKVVLLCDGEDISSHTATNTYKSIQEVIGIDYKTFSQLVYQSTNASLQFLSATDTNRKKFLIDLLHLEEYLVLLEVFKEAHRVSSGAMNEIGAQVSTIEKWLTNNVLDSTTLQPLLKLEINTDEDEQEARRLSAEIANISEKNKTITKNNQYKEMLSEIDLSIYSHLKGVSHESYDDTQATGGALEAGIRAANSALKELARLQDICPTCKQDIDPEFKAGLVSENEAAKAAAEENLENVNEKIERIKRSNREVASYSKAQRDWESLYQHIDRDLQTLILDKGELDRRLLGVQGRVREAQEKLHEISRENEQRTRLNTRIQVIQEQTDNFLEELASATATMEEQEKVQADLIVLKKAFSTNGILAYKIENLVKELEELGNTYLAELSDGRFTLEFVVSNDKLNVQITDDGSLVDITSLSSGELARVNTATLIAIRKLMSSISKSRINVLFLDEVIAVLDDVGREKLVEVLLAEENLNTFIVSHEWEHPLLSKLSILKRDGVSVIEV